MCEHCPADGGWCIVCGGTVDEPGDRYHEERQARERLTDPRPDDDAEQPLPWWFALAVIGFLTAAGLLIVGMILKH